MSILDVIARGFYVLRKGADVFIEASDILSEASEIFVKGVHVFNKGSDIIGEAFDVFNKGVYVLAKGFERTGKAKIAATPRTRTSTSRFLAHAYSQSTKSGRTCLFTTHKHNCPISKEKKCPLKKIKTPNIFPN